MAHAILMPKLGLTMKEGTIEEWKVKEGDAVKKGDVLFSVATEKLTNEVKSEVEGIVLKILLPEKETAPCLQVIAYIGESGEEIPEFGGVGTATETVKAVEPKKEERPAPVTSAKESGERIIASPAAKKLAKEKGIDLALIRGGGKNGRISVEDVEAYVTAGPKTSPMAAKLADEYGVDVRKLELDGRIMKADVLKAAGLGDFVQPEPEEDTLETVKVGTLRRTIAANMTRSWHTSPRVTYTHPVDTSAMKELRAKLRGPFEEKGINLTYNHILMKVAAKALLEFPDVNASFSDDMLTRHKHANIGLAVVKDDGLIVPIIKCADLKSLAEIAKETEELIERTRSGNITMDDITGGTFTISNLGFTGITGLSPIINQPELAILGVCAIVDTPVVRDGEIVIRPMMNLCLSADHRIIDGVMGANFLRRICDLMENPYLLLG